ncbi:MULTISPECIES: phosphoenolpyruvate carboxykinase (GTP) [Metallosphaera]|nr:MULTISPECIES: phosphoenolpyruvate carboxykinase (GTP) [Metallosphaera]AKV75354.1 phosphoenolpyruvate carboxykinase [Metallosphaera sedula]AKV77597.1 phosphoenolpyruvate carboxykinase [Metallosphaera sedula]AKV79843.1 phosphoenolpyruvate carboxykinase [Metallosphaera sedula]AKV82088.1 phosphoenolpyruvate carboxykinase [Metallosphaera sedula]AKV83428.1 phosphoenolpyruvate carboxykinase [Metallosphaera sedula]
MEVFPESLRGRLSSSMLSKLNQLNNNYLVTFLSSIVELCEPDSVYLVEGTGEDLEYVKRRALENGEEIPLRNRNHTIHFDHPLDQARAREDTFILSGKIPFVNTKPKEEGLKEVLGILKGSMRNREMFVGFYSLGPVNSKHRILAVQVTDSAYVIHSELMLYRSAFKEFRGNVNFLRFVHSKGTQDIKKRRIAIDLDGTVYSVNTTYAGNSVGLKKLALRLTLNMAVKEGWLSEHMAIIGIDGERTHYITASFPSGSGKTSTSMLGKLISDDLAFIRNVEGSPRAWNPESGVFGIIHGINSRDDPIIWEVLHQNDEVIFSNVLLKPDGTVYWEGSGEPEPEKGVNFAGEWWKGKKDENGKPIPASHPNARFTVRLTSFRNLDPRYEDPKGVEVEAMIFGVKDYNTLVPIAEAFDWGHGVITMGASMESARTSAVLGKSDEMEFNPMALLDFISVSLGKYLSNYLDFGKRLSKTPRIYSANYFLKDEKGFLNSKEDKRVWLRWIADRLEGKADSIRTPIGYIPTYDDLFRLFSQVLGKGYSRESYEAQFTIRLKGYKEKFKRIKDIYLSIEDTPSEVIEILDRQLLEIDKSMRKFGERVTPSQLE